MSPDPNAPYPISGYGAPPPGPPQDDTMAWAGIASSSVSWLTCCCAPIPFVGALAGLGGVLFAIVGIVCGVLGYQSAKRVGGRTDLPIIAIVIGSVRIVLTVGFVVLVVVLVGAAGVAAYFEQAGR